MNNHGLSKENVQIIKRIISNCIKNVEKVALFGSRAKGTFKKYSDIDLVLYGDVTEQNINRLWTEFSYSILPYKVDICLYKNIHYLPFKRHIDEVAEILFTREDFL